MKHCKSMLILLCLLCVLAGCSAAEPAPTVESVPLQYIDVNDKRVAIEDINAGIKAAFNNGLFYDPNGSLSVFLDTEVEYELYFTPRTEALLPRVYMIVTNMQYPLSNEELPQLYRFGFLVTENGLPSDFYEQGHVSSQLDYHKCVPEGSTLLGHYTMHISQITKPVYAAVTEQWKARAEAAVRLYMDNNKFYSEQEKNLQPGNYKIYIQGFCESDWDSTIIFEHENGQIYLGQYYFVQDIISAHPADLNHVELVEDVTADFIEYIQKIKQNAVLYMEHSITEKKYFTEMDFQSITVGKSTAWDVSVIAPGASFYAASYGAFCDLPMEDGRYIRIKFLGSDMIVGSIEVVEKS